MASEQATTAAALSAVELMRAVRGLYKLHSVPLSRSSKAPCDPQPLSLQSEKPVSEFRICFQTHASYRYRAAWDTLDAFWKLALPAPVVGLCKLNQVDP